MKNLQILLSKERLQSYASVEEHFENLALIARLTPKLATLEIILRNLLDNELSKVNAIWIESSSDLKIVEARERISKTSDTTCLTHHQYLSRLSFGVVIHTIRKEKLQNYVMNLKKLKFKKYDTSNRECFYFSNGKSSSFNNVNKVDIVLSLLHNLRNRCYHWENIKKLRYENNAYFPRLTTTMKGTLIGIHPSKIETFLGDLLKHFDDKLLKYCKI